MTTWWMDARNEWSLRALPLLMRCLHALRLVDMTEGGEGVNGRHDKGGGKTLGRRDNDGMEGVNGRHDKWGRKLGMTGGIGVLKERKYRHYS